MEAPAGTQEPIANSSSTREGCISPRPTASIAPTMWRTIFHRKPSPTMRTRSSAPGPSSSSQRARRRTGVRTAPGFRLANCVKSCSPSKAAAARLRSASTQFSLLAEASKHVYLACQQALPLRKPVWTALRTQALYLSTPVCVARSSAQGAGCMRSNTLRHTLIDTTAHRRVICTLQGTRGAPHEVQVEGLPDVLREAARERVVHARVVYPEVVLLPLRTGAPAISSPAQAVLNFGQRLAHTHSRILLIM